MMQSSVLQLINIKLKYSFQSMNLYSLPREEAMYLSQHQSNYHKKKTNNKKNIVNSINNISMIHAPDNELN